MLDTHGVLAAIGKTPLVRLKHIVHGLDAEILVKAEYLNPSGSIKDRIALRMVEGAERAGLLRPGATIVEASTGNTAAALALVAAVRGFRLRVLAPKVIASPERTRLVQTYGAEIEYIETGTPPKDEGIRDTSAHGAELEFIPRLQCLDLERSDPTVWWARQFSNPENVAAHREGTGMEILKQTEGKVQAFVASVGTGGTLMGVAQALLAHDPKIGIYGVEPAAASTPHLQVGLDKFPIVPGINDGIIVDILKANIVTGVFSVTDKEAIDMAHRLAEEEGLFCGMSSGANVLVAMQVAAKLGKGARVVTVLPDSRDRYLSLEKYTT
jgi:cysteine synthase A